ncbi:MAG: cation transporter [Treponemataceae bacterium]|nr:cation transporter [Treponemataceae bacterium]
MEKKIYCVGIDDDAVVAKVNAAVAAVAGVSDVTANADKAQVLVHFDESVAGIEDAINAAIDACGVMVL